jgi:hypothetical protein
MMGSNHPNQISVPHQEKTMRRRRYQKESLQERRHRKKRVRVAQYYDAEGHHRYHTLGRMADLTKSQAEQSQSAFMRTMNGGDDPEPGRTRSVLVTEFVNQVYLPFQRGKWRGSTAETSDQRIRAHIIQDLGNQQMEGFHAEDIAGVFGRKSSHLIFLSSGPSSLGSKLHFRDGGRREGNSGQPSNASVHSVGCQERSLPNDERD